MFEYILFFPHMICDRFKYLEQVTEPMVEYFLLSVYLLFLCKIFFNLVLHQFQSFQ